MKLPLTLAADHLYGFEGTGAAVVFLVGFAGLLVLGLISIRVGWRALLMGGALFASALTPQTNFAKTEYLPTWMLGAQTNRAELHLAFALLLTILVIVAGDVRTRMATFQGVVLLVMGLYAGVLQFFHDTPRDAMLTIGFALATIPCMIFGAPATARDEQGCMRLVRSLMLVSIVWTFCCSVQFLVNPQYLVNPQGRFLGMLGNAQQAAILVAPFAVVALWLLMVDRGRMRVLWTALLVINLLFLIWTGSRTGVLMLLVGMMLVLYSQMRKAVVFLPVAALVFYALYQLSDALQIGSNVERLVSTEDTRQGVWQRQFDSFLSSPVVGVGWGAETGGSEGSYFGGLAAYGVGYGALMFVLVVGSIVICSRLMLARRHQDAPTRQLIDLFCAFNAMYFAAAAFEGYILARSSTTLVMLLMFAGIGVYLNGVIHSPQVTAVDAEGYELEPQADAGYGAPASEPI